jgi:hypothetical protein
MARNGEGEEDASEVKRGVFWAESDFPGSQTILAYDGRGCLVLEIRFPEEYTDSESLGYAWDFLNAHDPVAKEGGARKRLALIRSDGGNRPPRKSKREKPETTRPTLTVFRGAS